MIYLPKRGLFVHIPRTAGNSVSAAIAGVTAGQQIDCLISTVANEHAVCPGLRRHATASELKPLIPEWDQIYRFCVARDINERLDSICRLLARDIRDGIHNDPTCPVGYRDLLLDPNHREIIQERQGHQTTDWYTLSPDGEDLGVDIIPFAELNDRWPEICDKLGIPQCSLPHLNKA